MRFLLCLLLSFAFPVVTYAQEFLENFDSVGIPALPLNWTNSVGAGTQAWKTTNTFSATSPQSAFVPIVPSVSDTRLTSPTILFPSAVGPVQSLLSFYHRHTLTDIYGAPSTSTFDGAVLEISIDGGAFVDVITAGGSFVSGGYDYSISSGSNPLNGRAAWAGNKPSFSLVEVNLPAINPGSSFRLRFRLGTDNLFGSGEWAIDNVRILPRIETSVSLIPSTTEVIAGDTLNYTFGVTNNSNITLSEIGGFILSSANPIVSFVNFSGGTISSYNAQAAVLRIDGDVPPGQTRQFTVAVQASTPRFASGVLKITAPADIAGTSFIVTPTSFSPLTSLAGINGRIASAVDAVGNTLDLCEAVSNPAEVAGKIASVSSPLGCSLMTKALNAQAAGAIAVIITDDAFLSPPNNEAFNPALTIPVVVISGAVSFSLLPDIVLPYLPNIDYNLVVSKDVLSLQVAGFGGRGEEIRINDNLATAVTSLLLDSDADGTPDPRDACPLDPAKITLGQCGCGVADLDTNANGIAQCRANEDIQERIAALTKAVKKLNGKNTTAQSTLKKTIKNLLKEIRTVTNSSAPGVTTTATSVNLKKLGSTANKETTKLLTRFSSPQKTNALKAVAKLKKGIAPL